MHRGKDPPEPNQITAMNRCCAKLRSLSLHLRSTSTTPPFPNSSAARLLFTASVLRQPALAPTPYQSFLASTANGPPILGLSALSASPSPFSHAFALAQVRYVSSRDRRKKRKPLTPVVSKVKKTKMKFYSSFKSRFRPMNDGNIRRWKEGKRHNAHLKSKKSKRRLRQPAVVHLAYAKVMKKLGFCS